MQRLEMSSTSAIDVLTTLCAFARISVGEASRRLRQLLVLGTLLTGSNAAIAAAPTFSWDNNSPPGQSGAGYPSWNAALSAAMASSQAGDVTSQDGCSLGPVSGAFPSWSIIMVGCADIRISAVCPAGAVLGLKSELRCLRRIARSAEKRRAGRGAREALQRRQPDRFSTRRQTSNRTRLCRPGAIPTRRRAQVRQPRSDKQCTRSPVAALLRSKHRAVERRAARLSFLPKRPGCRVHSSRIVMGCVG